MSLSFDVWIDLVIGGGGDRDFLLQLFHELQQSISSYNRQALGAETVRVFFF